MGIISNVFKIAFESVISNACEDGGKFIFSQLNNDKKRLKEFKREFENWENEFENKHDGTIVSQGPFYEYIQNSKDIDKIIKYVLSENLGFSKELLNEETFIKSLIGDLENYLNIEKNLRLRPIDIGAIQEFYNKAMDLSKSFILSKLIDSNNIKMNFKLNQIYYLINLMYQNTEETLRLFRQYTEGVSDNREVDYYILLKNLEESFLYERRNNPSFALISFDENITPEITLDVKTYATIDDTEKCASVKDFLHLSLKNEKNHIFLYGMGGIGKTVSLLSIEYSNPVIYIPIRNVVSDENCIGKYIKEQTLHSNDRDYKSLLNYCELSWDEKSHLILIIDGLNEVDNTLRKSILRELQNVWSRKRNIQLIVTSRNDMSYDLNCGLLWCLKTKLLSRETITEFLTTNYVEVPDQVDKIWNVIDTPLMLVLYVKNEYLRKRIKNNTILLRNNINSGAIIWNFLQSEVYRLQQTFSKNLFTGIIAVEFITPYIAYQMQKNARFIISQEEFRKYVNNAYELYKKCKEKGSLSSYMYSLIENEEGGDEINKDSLDYILTKKLCLFHKTENSIQLIHQHFRDCFAAIHIIHTSEMYDDVPQEWKTDFSPNVTEFIADLINTEDVFNFSINTWEKIWNCDYKFNNPSPCFIPQMLQLYKLCFGYDLSKVDFSYLDLSNVSLSGYKFSNKSKRCFVNTKLAKKTFIGNGHRKSITAISWSPSNKNFFSASHDCTVRMWDSTTKQETVLNDSNNFHKHYIRCGQWNPIEENSFITSGDDKHIVIWEKHDENIGWNTKSIGECLDWVVGLSWSNDGKYILCGERNGNIELFDAKGKLSDYDKIHTDYVRRIAWSKKNNELFATGSDDGLVCIWNIRQKTPIKTLKLKENNLQSITSINWLYDDKILAISDESTLCILDTEKLFALDEQEIICKNKDFVLKTKSLTKITFVAITSKSSYDYYSVFYEDGIEIFRGYTTAQHIYEFSVIAIKSIKQQNFNKIICADWNNKCDRIICGSKDGNLCEINIDISEEYMDRMSLYIIGSKNNNATRCVNWSHNNRFIAAGYDDCRVRIWDLENKKCIKVLDGHKDSVKCIVWSPDDRFVASGSDDCAIHVWNLSTEKLHKKLTNHLAAVNSILWLKSGHIISASDDKNIIKFNSITKEKSVPLKKHTDRIYSLAPSPDEKYIISAGNDRCLCLWDIEKCECIQSENSGHSEPIRGVAWSSNEIMVTGSNDCSWIVRKTDTSNSQLSREYTKKDNAHKDFIYSIAISNDNKYVITGSTDYTVGFWDIENQELICYGEDHDFFVWSVSPNNNINGDSYVATSSSDGTIKIWNTANLKDKEIHPETNLEVIANIDIVGCDFSGAIFDTEELKKLIETNGGLV